MKTANDRSEIKTYCKANKYFKRIINLDENIEAWAADYTVDILKELKGLNRWLIANPKKQPKNVADFVLRNLETAQNRIGKPKATTNEILTQLGADIPTTPKPEKTTINYAERKSFLAEQAEALKIRNQK